MSFPHLVSLMFHHVFPGRFPLPGHMRAGEAGGLPVAWIYGKTMGKYVHLISSNMYLYIIIVIYIHKYIYIHRCMYMCIILICIMCIYIHINHMNDCTIYIPIYTYIYSLTHNCNICIYITTYFIYNCNI